MSIDIKQIVRSGATGFYIGSRLILPFKCQLIKLIVDNHIVTEFVGNSNVKLSQEEKNTSVYFRQSGKLNEFEGSYEYIKMIVAPLDADLCDRSTHVKIVCSIDDNHTAKLELAEDNDDILFIE